MIATPVMTVPTEMKAQHAQSQSGQATGAFANHLTATTSADVAQTNDLHGSTALRTSLPLHKIVAKYTTANHAKRGIAPSNAANPATTAPNTTAQNTLAQTAAAQTAPMPIGSNDASANPVDDGSSDTGTAPSNSGTILAFINPSTTGQVQLAASLGRGSTIPLGGSTRGGLLNQSSQPGTSDGANPAGLDASAKTAAATNPLGTNPPADPSTVPTANIVPASNGSDGTTKPLPQQIGLPGDPAARLAGTRTTTFTTNRFGAPGATSATSDPTNAATSNPNVAPAAQTTSDNGSQTNSSGGDTNSSRNPPLAGAADLNARIVAGAANLTAQPTSAASSAANQLLQPRDPNAGAMPPSSSGGGSGDKGRGTSGLFSGNADGTVTSGIAAATTDTGNALHSFSTVLSHLGMGARDASPDAAANDTAASAPVSADGTDATASTTTLTSAQTNASPDQTTPTPTDAAVRPGMIAIPASEQVAIHLKQAIKNGSDEIQIQLKPASLGAIDVKLNVSHDGRLTAVISADRSDTLNLLKQNSGDLQQALRDAGFSADSSSLSFNMRGDTQSFAQNSSPQSAMPSIPSNYADDTATTGVATRALRQHSGSLDIQV